MNTEERVALVTGGGRGIGRAIAVALAQSGRAVSIGDLLEQESKETVDLITAAGGRAVYVPLDVTDRDSVAEAVRQTESDLGPIDILVNNAGWDDFMPFLVTDEAFWDKVIDINYKGNLRTARAIVPKMLDRKWGRVINIGSDAARVGSSFEAVYAGAKGAIISFSKTLAREVARDGVTVNVVCPGPTLTPAMQQVMGGDGGEMIDKIKRTIPMRRLAEPEDIAGAVVYLASDVAGFVTGQTLSVSGGLTMA